MTRVLHELAATSARALSDGVGNAALALGLACALALVWSRSASGSAWLRLAAGRALARERLVVALLASSAGALSWLWIVHYLRGGPRIVDATTYLLEARALAAGKLVWETSQPAASEVSRFLLARELSDGRTVVGAIFPPGYPALLAPFVLAGVPLALGPALAVALVVATWALAREVSRGDPSARGLPLVAALASTLSSTLRTHTADTMSHGAAALHATLALLFALSAARAPGRALLSGLFLGLLAATRPVTAAALGLVVLGLVVHRARARVDAPSRATRVAPLALVALGLAPGLALTLAHQWAVTGSPLASSQRAYYALSDGPGDCFRYGLGAGIGCLGEHGDFVRARLDGGYGLGAALGTTLRRLWMHAGDALSTELLAPLVIVGALRARGPARALALAACLVVLAYAPFYFDGNYPGGGARFFVDVLPLEHVLLARGLLSLAPASTRARATLAVVTLSLVGFGLRGAGQHAALARREGGLPMFEPERVTRALAATPNARPLKPLVFVSTDHGFALGHDPSGRAPFEVLRARGDDLDRLAWEQRGEPLALRYDYAFDDAGPEGPPARVSVSPLRFAPEPLTHARVSGASLWPALAQTGAWAFPMRHAGPLALHRSSEGGPAALLLRLAGPGLASRVTGVVVHARGPLRAALCVASGEGAAARCGEAQPSGSALVPPSPRERSLSLRLELVGDGPHELVDLTLSLEPRLAP
jgi:hypothetical protein